MAEPNNKENLTKFSFDILGKKWFLFVRYKDEVANAIDIKIPVSLLKIASRLIKNNQGKFFCFININDNVKKNASIKDHGWK